jgi:hypothetical protein
MIFPACPIAWPRPDRKAGPGAGLSRTEGHSGAKDSAMPVKRIMRASLERRGKTVFASDFGVFSADPQCIPHARRSLIARSKRKFFRPELNMSGVADSFKRFSVFIQPPVVEVKPTEENAQIRPADDNRAPSADACGYRFDSGTRQRRRALRSSRDIPGDTLLRI